MLKFPIFSPFALPVAVKLAVSLVCAAKHEGELTKVNFDTLTVAADPWVRSAENEYPRGLVVLNI